MLSCYQKSILEYFLCYLQFYLSYNILLRDIPEFSTAPIHPPNFAFLAPIVADILDGAPFYWALETLSLRVLSTYMQKKYKFAYFLLSSINCNPRDIPNLA